MLHFSLVLKLKFMLIVSRIVHRSSEFSNVELFLQVWVYKKTAQEKFPTLKKYSDQAPASDPHATREVKIDTEYKSSENPDLSIPPEQRAKAFKYGKNYIPIGEDVLKALKFETEKGIKLVGMVKSSKIPR